MSRRGDPRNGARYQKLRDDMRGVQPCVYCRQHIDDDIPSPHPASRVIAHDTSIADGGNALDPANAWPAHRLCNERAGTRSITGPPADPRTMRGGHRIGDLAWAIHDLIAAQGETSLADLTTRFGVVGRETLQMNLTRMVRRGMLIRTAPGRYAPGPGPLFPSPTAQEMTIHVDAATL